MEIVFWESVRDGDAAGFEAYLQQYPEGAFVPLARAALRRIEQADKTAETPSSALETQFDTLVEQDGVLVGRDCPECPEMVVVPAGSYRMGSRYGRTWTTTTAATRRRPSPTRPWAATTAACRNR